MQRKDSNLLLFTENYKNILQFRQLFEKSLYNVVTIGKKK
jgi:hypothetical protein